MIPATSARFPGSGLARRGLLVALGVVLVAALAVVPWLRERLLGQEVGYRGPLPSVEARRSLREVFGRSLPAGSVGFTQAELALEHFLVTPFAPSVIAAEVNSAQAEGREPTRHWIPVLTDGDIADLRRRAGLEVPAWMDGERSTSYERFLAGRND